MADRFISDEVIVETRGRGDKVEKNFALDSASVGFDDLAAQGQTEATAGLLVGQMPSGESVVCPLDFRSPGSSGLLICAYFRRTKA